MKRLIYIFVFFTAVFVCQTAVAQDTLPNFSVKNAGRKRIIIGWVNNFPEIKQISIQRSFDSTRNYKTLLSVADPKAIQNGFVDTQSPTEFMYYRLFYVLGNGMYYFTEAKKPVIDTTRVEAAINGVAPVYPGDTVAKNGKTVIKQPDYVPSFYVYAKNDGNVFINLPDADKKDYRLKFFEEDGTLLFEIKSIKETGLTLDKANFYHGGWFKFELYNDDKVVERHRLYISKNF
jgi:hypothetical protein